MRNRLGPSLCAWMVLAFPSLLPAQIESGPAVGSKVETLKVRVATGDEAGKEIDLAPVLARRPALVVFVQAERWDRPMARFLRALDQDASQDRRDVAILAVWLTDNQEKAREYLPRAQESLKLARTTFTVHPGDRSGPKGWGINADAHVTAVVVEEGKVSARFGFLSVNETDAPEVLKALKAKK